MTEIIVLRLEMGMTDGDFERVFPPLVAPAAPGVAGRTWTAALAPGGRVAITLSAQKPRRIAGLTLPCMDVRLAFRDCTPAYVDEFMLRFDRAFHKGGG